MIPVTTFEALEHALAKASTRASHLCIGGFDGLHLGHQSLLAGLPREKPKDEKNLVITFDLPPRATLTPRLFPGLLLGRSEKMAILAEYPIDYLLELPFTRALRNVPPRVFLEKYLAKICHAGSIHVGFNFHFGFERRGTGGTIRAFFKDRGVKVEVHPPVTDPDTGENISSTLVRGLVKKGLVARAALLLGRPFSLSGTVVRGRGRGRNLGYPTLNLGRDERLLLPRPGVYAGVARLAREGEPPEEYRAAIVIGRNLTFREGEDKIEAYLIGFHGNLYGRAASLRLFDYLRPLKRFAQSEDLVRQAGEDIERVRQYRFDSVGGNPR